MKESVIEGKLRKKVVDMGGRFFKWVSPGNDGVPDRIAVFPGGRIYFVELKTDEGRLTSLQIYQQDTLRDLGCNVTTVYGETGIENFVESVKDDEV